MGQTDIDVKVSSRPRCDYVTKSLVFWSENKTKGILNISEVVNKFMLCDGKGLKVFLVETGENEF